MTPRIEAVWDVLENVLRRPCFGRFKNRVSQLNQVARVWSDDSGQLLEIISESLHIATIVIYSCAPYFLDGLLCFNSCVLF